MKTVAATSFNQPFSFPPFIISDKIRASKNWQDGILPFKGFDFNIS